MKIIIGAGITGLACASQLGDCLVLEESQAIGGLCRTVRFDGFGFDLGGHRLFCDDPAITDYFFRLLPGRICWSPRKSEIWMRGTFFPYPLRISGISRLPLSLSMKAFATYWFRRFFPVRDHSFWAASVNSFGDTLYNTFIRDYTLKAWGVSPENLSRDLASLRLQRISLRHFLKRVWSGGVRFPQLDDYILYPRVGIDDIPVSLAQRVHGAIRCGCAVTGFEHNGTSIKRVVTSTGQIYDAETVVSTMPLTNLCALLHPPSDVMRALSFLRYRGVIFVFLTFRKPSITSHHWIYFSDERIFVRLHEPKNWSAAMAPKESTGVCAEIFCNYGDSLWNMSDEEIAAKVIRDFPFTGPGEVTGWRIVRERYCYPIYTKDYQVHRNIVLEYVGRFTNLHVCGRAGSFAYLNMDPCIAQGLQVGASLAGSASVFV